MISLLAWALLQDLSEKEIQEWAKSVETEINKGGSERLDKSLDRERFLDAVTGGVEAKAEYNAGFAKGFPKSWSLGKSILQTAGSRYRFLRVRSTRGAPTALFRLVSEQGLNYQEWLQERQ